jgi:hypothetical protein
MWPTPHPPSGGTIMKKLFIIPAVLAVTSLSGAAFAGDHNHFSGATWTNSFNTTNKSDITQSIKNVKGYNLGNSADVTQLGAQVVGGKNCLCKNNLKDSFNTSNTSTIKQSIEGVKWGSNIGNTATVFQAGSSFTPTP